MEPVTLRTARLELSPPVEADVDTIFEACQDPDIQRFTLVPSPYERAHAEGFVRLVAEWWQADSEYTWAIRADGGFAGVLGLRRAGDGAAEIGYWMAAPARGNGYLTEAARAVVDWGFSSDGIALERIEWRAAAGNVASARVARALGFRYEGTLRQAFARGTGARSDAWIAGLLRTDDRTPRPWPVLS